MTVVSGRVRGTLRLREDEVGATCVLATSWSSERTFPRTVGVGVTFEIETTDGQVLRVDPFDAVVALPVRRYDRRGGVLREYAWIGPDDEVTVEGDLDGGAPGPSQAPPCLRATRIAVAAAGCTRHHVPPRALRAGQVEDSAADASPEAEAAAEPASPSTTDAGAQAPGDPQAVPRRKRKRTHTPPPGSGTPPAG